MRENQDKIRELFMFGLRRIGKLLSPDKALKVKSIAQEDALVFWYEQPGERKRRVKS